MKTSDTVVVCFDWTNGVDKSILAIGRKTPGEAIDIINVFSGEEAEALYSKLTQKKEN